MPDKSPDTVTGRRALVTGASSGIGEAFARRLARDRYDLTLVARNKERLTQLADKLRSRHAVGVKVVVADLTKTQALRRVEREIESEDRLELLVNNAGFGTMGQFAELDIAVEDEEIRLNVLAVVRLTRAALPAMITRRRGAIINVSSMAGFQPSPTTTTYGATKAFVNTFTEGLHEELHGTGVQVQALCPGFTRTEFQQRANIDVSALPAIAWMEPDEVVEESLAGLNRGDVLCVPGLLNRFLASTVMSIPRPVARRILGIAARQVLR